jgi:hypothetical protein
MARVWCYPLALTTTGRVHELLRCADPTLDRRPSRPMAKRARGTNTRPGQRARLRRRGPATPRLSSPVSPPSAPSVSLTPQEEARAAELEAEIVATEREAERSAQVARKRAGAATVAEPRVRAGSIAVRASEEYGYVSRDVRRIALIGGSLVAILVGFWAVVQATGTRFF